MTFAIFGSMLVRSEDIKVPSRQSKIEGLDRPIQVLHNSQALRRCLLALGDDVRDLRQHAGPAVLRAGEDVLVGAFDEARVFEAKLRAVACGLEVERHKCTARRGTKLR